MLPSRPPDADEFTLRDIFRAIRRRSLLVAFVAVACEGLAAVFAVRERPMFRTTAVLRFTDPKQAMPQGIAPVDRDPNGASNIVLSQMELLRSKTLIGLVVDSLGLRLRVPDTDAPPIRFTGVRIPADLRRDTVTLEF